MEGLLDVGNTEPSGGNMGVILQEEDDIELLESEYSLVVFVLREVRNVSKKVANILLDVIGNIYSTILLNKDNLRNPILVKEINKFRLLVGFILNLENNPGKIKKIKAMHTGFKRQFGRYPGTNENTNIINGLIN